MQPGGLGIRLTDEQRMDWMQLAFTDGVGPRTFRDLINFHGTASRGLDALPGIVGRASGRSVSIFPRAQVEREIEVAARLNVQWTGRGEPDYPDALRHAEAPPPLVALRGQLGILHKPMVGLVGSRNASIQGLKMARLLARELGEAGFTTVSGLARGIDAAAHDASLLTGTVAVLAGGHDRIYPPEHEDLLGRILDHGVAISEMRMGHDPRARDFPRRNRIIAGLSKGVVIVEAAERSGSLITARMALEENRDVFAVPGSPLDPRAAGTNRLLKQGAMLVTETRDVIEGLAGAVSRAPEPFAEVGDGEDLATPPPEPVTSDRTAILSLLGPVGADLDDVIAHSGRPARLVRFVIMELELSGLVRRQAGGQIVRL